MKTCLNCGHTLALTQFSVRKNGWIQSECKQCSVRRAQKWYVENQERAKTRIYKWREERPDKVATYQERAKAKPDHKERRRAVGRRYSEHHAAELRERIKQWRRANPDKHAAQQRRNKGRRRGAPGTFSRAEWDLLVWLFQGHCAYCWMPKKLEPDHVIPISKGGSNYIENILPACRSCNSRKGDRLITL